ncbi:MAG: hypothetical protein H5T40_04765 [Methanobacteriales archaeon]|nr:hypothetical protein [Methanobacteriales archaeon]
MDKTTKALFIVCFVLVGALGFTTGLLLQEKPILPSKTTKNTTITSNPNKTTSNVNNANKTNPTKSSGGSSGMISPEEAIDIVSVYGTENCYYDVYYDGRYYQVTVYDSKHPEYGAIGGATVDPYTGEIVRALG